jgi:uncharacterized protein YheU (UPF0270 family)
MKIDVTTDIVAKRLRPDVVEALGNNGIEAIINYYNTKDPNMKFEPSLFENFNFYIDLEAAMMEIYPEAVQGIIDNFTTRYGSYYDEIDIDWEESHESFLRYFLDHGRTVILLDEYDIFNGVLISKQ